MYVWEGIIVLCTPIYWSRAREVWLKRNEREANCYRIWWRWRYVRDQDYNKWQKSSTCGHTRYLHNLYWSTFVARTWWRTAQKRVSSSWLEKMNTDWYQSLNNNCILDGDLNINLKSADGPRLFIDFMHETFNPVTLTTRNNTCMDTIFTRIEYLVLRIVFLTFHAIIHC